jgi:hypothetical protein
MVVSNSQMSDAEETVRIWLDSNEARYLWQGDDQRLPLDFVVYSPFCIGIEVREVSSPISRSLKAKRGLSARTDLVDDFGSELPLVVITVGGTVDVNPSRLLADAVFPVDALPPFQELRTVRVDPDIREVLKRGAPREINITDMELLEEYWSRSLALSELVDRNDFPPGSLAYLIHETASTILQDNVPGDMTHRPGSLFPLRNRTASMKPAGIPPSPLDFLLKRRDFYEAVGNLIAQRAVGSVGGRMETPRIKLSSRHTNLMTTQAAVWRLDNGRQIALRRLNVGESSVDHKARELIAEAWLLRATESLVNPHLYLLLTDSRRTLPLQTIAGPRRSTMNRDLIKGINHFESAGWQVFPWDFAESEPDFIKAARTLSEGLK